MNKEFEKWIKCFDGEDKHSITNQIHLMNWNTAAFEIVNEARLLAPKDAEGNFQLNGLLHGLINSCYFHSHLLAIRKLLDGYGLDGNRSVYSMRSLLNDMKDHLAVLTRENIFEAHDIPYSIVPGSLSPENPTQYFNEWLHGVCDELSGADPQRRAKGDTVNAKILNCLLSRLDLAAKKIIDYCNKFITHAASPEDRSRSKADEIRLTLAELRKADKCIMEVANFLSINIYSGVDLGFLATPQYDQFEFIDFPLVQPEQIAGLRKKWHQLDNEIGTAKAPTIMELAQEQSLQ
jgi:hypothetical protein